jgi:hypothetical protein
MQAAAISPPQKHRWYRRKRFYLLVLLVAFAIWLIKPSTYSAGGIRFSVHYTGTPGELTFVVRDSRGAPKPGVTVMSESFSGTTQEFATGATGVATISPGESEVLAVYIDGREFRFRPRNSFFEYFAPDCSCRGLTFRVSIDASPGNY